MHQLQQNADHSESDTSHQRRQPGSELKSWKDKLAELKRCAWYWGDISWMDSRRLLLLCDEGTFLMRDSLSESYLFSISYVHQGKVYHTRIEMNASPARFGLGPLEKNESIVRLFTEAVQNCSTGSRHMLMHRRGEEAQAHLLRLKEPLTRHSVLPRLQYLCRSLVLTHLKDPSEARRLALSPSLIEYVMNPKNIVPDVTEAIQVLSKRRTYL